MSLRKRKVKALIRWLALCMLGKKKSADDILKYFFLFLLENKIWYFMQIVLHEIASSVF